MKAQSQYDKNKIQNKEKHGTEIFIIKKRKKIRGL